MTQIAIKSRRTSPPLDVTGPGDTTSPGSRFLRPCPSSGPQQKRPLRALLNGCFTAYPCRASGVGAGLLTRPNYPFPAHRQQESAPPESPSPAPSASPIPTPDTSLHSFRRKQNPRTAPRRSGTHAGHEPATA